LDTALSESGSGTSIADPDSDPAGLFNADPDSGPACHLDADPVPTFHFDADPDPDRSLKIKAQNFEKMV
jgi:hypothetical protein